MRFSHSLPAFALLLICSAEFPSITSTVATTTSTSSRDEFSASVAFVSIPPVSITPVSIMPVSITPVSITLVSITPVSITPVSIPSLSLDLPTNTCTPGASSYATPATHGYVPADACNAFWHYSPDFAVAVVFSVLFGILTVTHLVQAALYRNGFCWVVVMAALWETGAYIFRALGAKDQQSAGIATVAQILVLVAPIWVNAYAYMIFARIVHFFSPARKVWVFSPTILAIIFITLDIVAFIIQLIGGGMAGPGASPESQSKGLNLYMGGIGMQEGFIILFLGLAVKFHRDQLHAARTGRLAADKIAGWRWMLWALYTCMLAITIRIVYRLVEFSAGLGISNPLPKNEPLLYILESTPMFLAILVWNIFHPGRYMYGDDANLPPSWLSRHMGCCFRQRCCKKFNAKDGHVQAHHRLYDGSRLEDNQEMQPFGQACGNYAAAPVNPFLDTPSRNI